MRKLAGKEGPHPEDPLETNCLVLDTRKLHYIRGEGGGGVRIAIELGHQERCRQMIAHVKDAIFVPHRPNTHFKVCFR